MMASADRCCRRADQRWPAIRRAIGRPVLLADILLVPVLVYRIRHLGQPGPILAEFKKIRCTKEFDAVGRRIAQGLQQAGGDQHRNVVRLAIQHPSRLLDGQPGRQLLQERQEPMLIFSPTQSLVSLKFANRGCRCPSMFTPHHPSSLVTYLAQ